MTASEWYYQNRESLELEFGYLDGLLFRGDYLMALYGKYCHDIGRDNALELAADKAAEIEHEQVDDWDIYATEILRLKKDKRLEI